ncbi:hypothetical protein Rsub_10847 [Raphidocelis subcapitata]|uniref:Calcineurin-like phosphoesterase domain-containing protein n=1 Tax=Raphidocelis subcapitata TaxID=307507 RepID=A0A2V0PE18_9CHLO|nr:hypothetical protein Rsub_10847 [Raphidocelis subcapitata]|eukprot:GBF98101.1 hypothetical protein Rsub_10847 [Raphidocelis subcapitata]
MRKFVFFALLPALLAWAAASHLGQASPVSSGAVLSPAVAPQPGDLFAIADLHGDYDKAVQSLRLLGLVDEALNWAAAASNVTLVQAPKWGSRVVQVLGNHDVFSLAGDTRYVSREEVMRLGAGALARKAHGEGAAGRQLQDEAPPPAAAGGAAGGGAAGLSGDPGGWPAEAQAAALAAGYAEWNRLLGAGEAFGDALRDRALVAVEGEGACRTLFVHAGLVPRTLRELVAAVDASSGGPGAGRAGGAGGAGGAAPSDLPALTPKAVARINAAAASLLARCVGGVCRFWGGGADAALPADPSLVAAVTGNEGPVWNRVLALGEERAVCAAADRLLAAADGAARVVVGHTVMRDGRARARCGGRVLLLDTGMSAEMSDAPAAGWVCRAGGGGGGADKAGAGEALRAVLYADGLRQAV